MYLIRIWWQLLQAREKGMRFSLWKWDLFKLRWSFLVNYVLITKRKGWLRSYYYKCRLASMHLIALYNGPLLVPLVFVCYTSPRLIPAHVFILTFSLSFNLSLSTLTFIFSTVFFFSIPSFYMNSIFLQNDCFIWHKNKTHMQVNSHLLI